MDIFYNIIVNSVLARSLKEKGFNEDCFAWYTNKMGGISLTFCWEMEDTPKTNSRLKDNKISAPTYDQVIEWLNKLNINLLLTYSNEGYGVDIFEIDTKELLHTTSIKQKFFVRKYILEYGINEALKFIK